MVYSEGVATAYYDNKWSAKEVKNVTITEQMKYFCNGKDGLSPIGIVCDFKLYSVVLPVEKLKEITFYSELRGLPDRNIEILNSHEIILYLKNIIERHSDVTRVQALEALGNLLTKASCRGSLLRNDGIQLLFRYTTSPDASVKYYTSRALINLA